MHNTSCRTKTIRDQYRVVARTLPDHPLWRPRVSRLLMLLADKLGEDWPDMPANRPSPYQNRAGYYGSGPTRPAECAWDTMAECASVVAARWMACTDGWAQRWQQRHLLVGVGPQDKAAACIGMAVINATRRFVLDYPQQLRPTVIARFNGKEV